MKPKKSKDSSQFIHYALVILIALIVVASLTFTFSGRGSVTGQAISEKSASKLPSPRTTLSDNDAVLGNKNAKVTIVAFSDYTTLFSRKFDNEAFQSIKKDYIDTGRVKFVFRDYPLTTVHPMSQKAAEAAECIREQGGDFAYWRMHDKIFREQNVLDTGDSRGPVTRTVHFTEQDLQKWAREIGFNINKCLADGVFKNEVLKDLADGKEAGVRGSPAFLINNKPINGAQPYSTFKTEIDMALARS